MEYLTGTDYSGMCSICQTAIDDAYELIINGFANEEYADDNEGPCMLAYDRGWLSDERRCCQ